MDQAMSAASELAVLVPEYWSAKLYPTLKEKLPFNSLIASDYEDEIQQLGDTVRISQFPQFDEAEDLAETGRANAEALTASQSSLVINHMLVKDYIVTYMAEVQAVDVAANLSDLAMFSIMKKMQKIIIADTVASSAAPDHQISYDSGSTLAQLDILEGKELLDTQNVEEVGRQLVAGAAQYNDLLNITGFVSRDFIASGNPNQSGAVASPLYGFNVNWTTEASAVTYLFHPLYMQMAVQRAPKVGVYDLGVDGKRGTRFNFTVLFGNIQMDNKRVVEIA